MKTKQLHHWRIVASSLSVLTGKASFVDCLISTHVRGVKLVTVEVEGVTQRDCSGTISGARRSICKLTISISGCSIVVGAGYIGVVCIYNINQTRRYNEERWIIRMIVEYNGPKMTGDKLAPRQYMTSLRLALA
ncbi:hypothetical protein P692DRAFT_20222156 [Suillus brevipes Sb2]|nr:hypothetical protein P692DRAFT_20222156 [Suillus brevipes Sb2]